MHGVADMRTRVVILENIVTMMSHLSWTLVTIGRECSDLGCQDLRLLLLSDLIFPCGAAAIPLPNFSHFAYG